MRLWGIVLGLLAYSAQAAELDYGLQPQAIAADTYVVEGLNEHFSFKNGGNIVNTAFIVTTAGVVVIDTGPSRLYGVQLKAAIARLTTQPVTRVYITHLHPDHFLGNQAFSDAEIQALPDTMRGIAALGQDFATNMYRLAGDWMLGTEPVTPTSTVTPGTLDIGGHTLELLALSGHSAADLVIFDHTTGVLFASDLVFNQRTPTTPTAHIPAWLASLERLQALDFKILVPGHGPVVSDGAAIAVMNDYLHWLSDSLHTAAEQGVTMAEALELPIPERFQGLAVLRPEYRRSVSHLYPALEQATLKAANAP